MSESTQDQQALVNGRTFVWHELYVPDQQAGIDFYTEALDFGTEAMDMCGMGTYHMLSRQGKSVSGVVSTNDLPTPNIPPHWAVYISVDDVDARVAKCVELGAKVAVEAMDVPTVGRMALIVDPQGAYVWLFTPAPM